MKHDQSPGMLRGFWSGGTAGNWIRPWRCTGGFGQRHSVKLAVPGTGFREPVACDIFRNIKANK